MSLEGGALPYPSEGDKHQSWRTLGGQLGPRKDAPRWLQPGRGREAARPEGPAGAGQEVTAARDPAAGAGPAGPAWWAPTKLRGSCAAPTSELSDDFLQTQIVIVAVQKCFTVLGPHPSPGNQAFFQPPPTPPPVSMKASVSQRVGRLPLVHTLAHTQSWFCADERSAQCFRLVHHGISAPTSNFC